MNEIQNEGRTTRRVAEVADSNPLVSKKWLLDNGAHEVELIDASEATWEKYCQRLARANWKQSQEMASRDERQAILQKGSR